jgi:hypothetical protein
MAFIDDVLLSQKNPALQEGHLLAGSGLHREGFQDQRMAQNGVMVQNGVKSQHLTFR